MMTIRTIFFFLKGGCIAFLIFVLLLPGLTGLAQSANKITDWDRQNLKGEVMEIFETRYSTIMVDDTLQKDTIVSQRKTSFDPWGRLTGTILYKGGTPFLFSEYQAGPSGLTERMEEHYSDGTLSLIIKYVYNDDSVKTAADYEWHEQRMYEEEREKTDIGYEVVYENNFVRALYEYQYKGYCTKEILLIKSGSALFTYTYKYDFRENKIEMNYFNSSGRLKWRTKYKYGRYNNMSVSEIYISNRLGLRSKYNYQMDEIGNWIRRTEIREKFENLFTQHFDDGAIIIEREISYYITD